MLIVRKRCFTAILATQLLAITLQNAYAETSRHVLCGPSSQRETDNCDGYDPYFCPPMAPGVVDDQLVPSPVPTPFQSLQTPEPESPTDWSTAAEPVTDSSPLSGTTMPPATVAPNLATGLAGNFGSGGARSLPHGDGGFGGYIDPAIVRTQARLRFEAAYGFNRADRAEFFYTTWTTLGGKNPAPPGGFPEPDLDRQQFNLYYEHAFGRDDNFSLFVDLPIVFNDPLFNANDQGIGDMQAGLKFSLHENCCSQLTFQLKSYLPTAKESQFWLGTGHYSIEPGLLYLRRLGGGWTLETELRDWISIDGAVNPNNGEDYAGNVLRYGVGLGRDLGYIGSKKVTPVVEFVGWSVLDGQVFEFNDDLIDPTNPASGQLGPQDATGDTIVNVKVGTRISDKCGRSFYAGWGHSLTGDRWYQDIFRIEMRRMF